MEPVSTSKVENMVKKTSYSMSELVGDNIDYIINENTLVKNVYSQIAPHFKDTRAYQWSWIHLFMSYFNETHTVYDIGCGSGRNIDPEIFWNSSNENPQMMASNKNGFPKCIGVDNCSEFVNICRDKGLTAIHSDMTNIPLDSNTADGILSIASFHHLASAERRISALTEMKRLLKPGGKILLSVWSIKQPEKTRRTFENYGDVIVPWNQSGKIYERYYYIFKIDEITNLFHQVGLKIAGHEWDCGNEIFILTKDTT